MRRAETLAALVMTLGAAAMVREAMTLRIGWTGSGPGAGFFPFWLRIGSTISSGSSSRIGFVCGGQPNQLSSLREGPRQCHHCAWLGIVTIVSALPELVRDTGISWLA